MMDYLDQVRAGRAGVSPEGAITDNMIGDRVGSQGVAQMMSQKEELVGLMVRVIAETGIKPLCYKIRNEARKNQKSVSHYIFRGQWAQVDPSTWVERSHTTVRVGTGSGNRKEQLQTIQQIMAFQEKIMMNPSQSLITEEQVFNAANDFAKFAGMPSVRKYLLDPKSPQGQQNKKAVSEANAASQEAEQKEKQVMAEATAKVAEAEAQKARVAEMNAQLKSEIDFQKNQLTLQKQQADNESAYLRQQLEEAKVIVGTQEDEDALRFKYYEVDERLKVERERISQQAKAASDNNNKETGSDE
jgi:hypothetical protein